jgi:hypothetical protein
MYKISGGVETPSKPLTYNSILCYADACIYVEIACVCMLVCAMFVPGRVARQESIVGPSVNKVLESLLQIATGFSQGPVSSLGCHLENGACAYEV